MATRKYVRDEDGKFASTPGGGSEKAKVTSKPTDSARATNLGEALNKLSGPKSRELRQLRKERWAAHEANKNDPENHEDSGDRYFRRERRIENKYFRDSAAVKKRYADEIKKRKEIKARAKAVVKAQKDAAAAAKAAKPKPSAAKRAAQVATAAAVAGAVLGGVQVNNVRIAANARHDQRAATAAAMRAMNGF